MRRGFKSQAEKCAAAARQSLQLSAIAPLDPRAYAAFLGVVVLEFAALGLTPASIRQLTLIDPDSWSAMTLSENGVFAIVTNPAHAPTRQKTDLMHELAHIELKHTPARVEVSKTGVMLLSDYSDDQEQEADWHSGAMLLPRNGLMYYRSRGNSADEIARVYGVSASLCEWRLRMTGIDVQMRRARLG